MSRIIDEIEIYEESNGLIVKGKALDSTIPTTAGRFVPGADILGVDGKLYRNAGTTASPSWQDTDSITTTEIADGAVTNAKVNASAAIAYSKLAAAGDGKILVGATGTGILTAYTPSGDITISNTGVMTISSSYLDGHVPYTGATDDVDLGEYNLKANEIETFDIISDGFKINIGGGINWNDIEDGAYLSETVGENGKKQFGTDDGKYAVFNFNSITENETREYDMPDASGTLALLADGVSGDVVCGSSTITILNGIITAIV